MHKRVANTNITISEKGDENKITTVRLTKGKVVTSAQLKKLTTRQVNQYTDSYEEPVKTTLKFLTPEDKKFHRENKNHEAMPFALSFFQEE